MDIINVHGKKIKTMSKTEAAVLVAIKADNSITAKKIAEKIGKSEKTVYRAITQFPTSHSSAFLFLMPLYSEGGSSSKVSSILE